MRRKEGGKKKVYNNTKDFFFLSLQFNQNVAARQPLRYDINHVGG